MVGNQWSVISDEGAAGWIDVGFFCDGDPSDDGVPGATAERLGIVEWSNGILGGLIGPIKDAAFGIQHGDLAGRCGIGGWVGITQVDPAKCLFAAIFEAGEVPAFWLRVWAFAWKPLDPCAVAVEDRNVVVRLSRDR